MSIRSPLLSDHLAAKLTDPTSALAAAFIIANRHLEILQWVARMIGVEPPPKPNGVGNGAKPPPVRKRRGGNLFGKKWRRRRGTRRTRLRSKR